MKNFILTTMVLVLSLIPLTAQDNLENNSTSKFDVGVHFGASNSGTDTHSWGQDGASLTNGAQLSYGLNLKYHLSNSFALRLNYFGSKLTGNDNEVTSGPCYDINGDKQDLPCHLERAWSYSSPIHEISFDFEWEPFGNKRYSIYNDEEIENGLRIGKFVKNNDGKIMRVDPDGSLHSLESFKKIISPYVTAGIAFTITDPDIDFGEAVIPNPDDVTRDAAETGSTINIPIGLGLRFDLSEKIYTDLEFRTTIPTNDFIDGIHYVTGADEDRNANDSYQFGMVRLGYRFGGSTDTDGDGIHDKEDTCPFVPGKKQLNGCPDSDADGIADHLDNCPDSAGPEKLKGCPDADDDGIIDANDKCPQTKGLAMFSGCPDTDGDGIIDPEDDCPEIAGLKAFNGCEGQDRDNDGFADETDPCPEIAGEFDGCPDTDKDGIADHNDKCPEIAGTALGCPDEDNDGIMDKIDNCPQLAGPASNNGCPDPNVVTKKIPTESEIKAVNFIMKDIRFVTNSDGVTQESASKLDEAANFAIAYPDVVFLISGYTDSIGDAAYNQRLSERRAKRVYNEMIDRGVEASKLRYAGFGEEDPIGNNGTEDGRASNRRVEISVVKN